MGAGQGWRVVRWPPGIQAAKGGPDFWGGGREDGGRESMQHPGRVCVCVWGGGIRSRWGDGDAVTEVGKKLNIKASIWTL